MHVKKLTHVNLLHPVKQEFQYFIKLRLFDD